MIRKWAVRVLADCPLFLYNFAVRRGQNGTNRADVSTLADLYICRELMQEKVKIEASGSEFAACINGKCFSEVMPFLEELMDTLKIIQPRLYDAFMAKIR